MTFRSRRATTRPTASLEATCEKSSAGTSVKRSLVIALIGCIHVLGASAKSCDRDFGVFLRKFESDRSFQERHIRFPIPYVGRDRSDCYPDCPVATHMLELRHFRKMTDPLFPLTATQQEMNLAVQFEVIGTAATVEVFLPEADSYSFEFRFTMMNSCWRLSHVLDRCL